MLRRHQSFEGYTFCGVLCMVFLGNFLGGFIGREISLGRKTSRARQVRGFIRNFCECPLLVEPIVQDS